MTTMTMTAMTAGHLNSLGTVPSEFKLSSVRTVPNEFNLQ